MGKTFRKHSVAVGLFVVLLFVSFVGIATAETGDSKGNPHTSRDNCGVCHLLPKNKLESFFTSSAMKRQLRADHVTLCRGCHDVRIDHGVGKAPEMNREGLPVAEDGTITCATTCHSMHVKNPADEKQEYYHLRLPIAKICFSCHEK